MKVCIAYTITDRLLKEEAEQHGEVIGEKEAESLRYEKNCVHFTPNRLELRSTGAFGSLVHLYPVQEGTAIVTSPYGKMVLKTVLRAWSQNESEWMVDYRLLDEQGQIIGDRRIVWHMTPLE